MDKINARVLRDIQNAIKNLPRVFDIRIKAEDNNVFNVHFVLSGPEGTAYEGGLYHGMIKLDDNHPHRPPKIYMITPNGRFDASTYPLATHNYGICMTLSAFFPDEWSPVFNLEMVIVNLFTLMGLPCTGNYSGIGGIQTSQEETKIMTENSWNHLVNDPEVEKLFPDIHADLKNGTYKFIKFSER